MGDHQQSTVWQEIMQGGTKLLTWLAYISIGVMAKLAFDSRSVRLTKRQIIIKTVLSIFCGYVAAQMCESLGHTSYIGFVSPVATLLGESIILYVMNNWKRALNKFLPANMQAPVTKKDETND